MFLSSTYLKCLCIAIVAFSICMQLNAQEKLMNVNQLLEDPGKQLQKDSNGFAQSALKNFHHISGSMKDSLTKQLRDRMVNNSTLLNLNKIIDKKQAFSFKNGVLDINSNMAPAVYSPSIFQNRLEGEFKIAGIKNQMFSSQRSFDFNNILNDFSFKVNVEERFREVAAKITKEYSSALKNILSSELTSLKELKKTYSTKINKNIDSLLTYSKQYNHLATAGTAAAFNYENLILENNSSLNEYKKLANLLEQLNSKGANATATNIKRLTAELEGNISVMKKSKVDSLINKYEELIGAEHQKLITPGKLKQLLKINQLQQRLGILMWAKHIDVGNFFSSATHSGLNKKAEGVGLGNISQGVKLTLNQKNNITAFIGETINDRFDAVWHPNQLKMYQNSFNQGKENFLSKLNTHFSISNIEALAGVNLSYSQVKSEPNAAGSFFGLNRMFKSFNLSRQLLSGTNNLTVDLVTHITSYLQNGSNLKDVPELPSSTSSLSFNIFYEGQFQQLDLEVNSSASGSLGANTISNTGNYDRPDFNGDLFVKKYFNQKRIELSGNISTSAFSMGAGMGSFFSRSALLNGRLTINRKNAINLSVVEQVSKNSGNPHNNFENRNYSTDISHQTGFKKNGLRYAIFSRVGSRQVQQHHIFSSTKTAGWVTGIHNMISINFPRNISLQHMTDVSINSFANNIFLAGNRITLAPGVALTHKNFGYSTALVFEKVTNYYTQTGVKNNLTYRGQLMRKEFYITAALDTRYNLQQQRAVFSNKIISFGNLGFRYSVN